MNDRETALLHLDDQIAAHPEAPEPRIQRARLLVELGRETEARDAYMGALKREPSHRIALNELGRLLHSTGFRTAARTVFAEGVKRHPNDAVGHLHLANALYENGEFELAREHYQSALRYSPGLAEAHRGLSWVLAECGDTEAATEHRKAGFAERPVHKMPYRGQAAPVRVLLLVAAAGGNLRALNFLDDRVFETTMLVTDYFDPENPLPAHDIVMNGIGDADLAGEALESARRILTRTKAPVLNAPDAVIPTGRVNNAQRLAGIPGVVAPRMVQARREFLAGPAGGEFLQRSGLNFPLLLRAPGFHTGRHFLRVDHMASLEKAIAEIPGAELTAIEYLDSRHPDGAIRKYRAMFIDGAVYPLHAAISTDWKIHYFTADMATNSAHRAEDARFIENMVDVLSPRANEALRQIQRALGLDYAGIDFGLSAEGDVLFFEANATMVVQRPDADALWDYRRPAVERIFDAVHRMLLRHAGR